MCMQLGKRKKKKRCKGHPSLAMIAHAQRGTWGRGYMYIYTCTLVHVHVPGCAMFVKLYPFIDILIIHVEGG